MKTHMGWYRCPNSPTFRLFNECPTFLTGFTSVFDLYQPLEDKYKTDSTEQHADSNSLESDWLAVGNDMRSALSKYERIKN